MYAFNRSVERTDFKHSAAVENTLRIFDTARRAGVRRIVHTSITNPSEDSPLECFSCKAKLECALRESGLSYAILRPTVIFSVFGDGQYCLQPIYVDDFAELAVAQGRSTENRIIDAIGPETYTYRGLVEDLREIIGVRRPIIPRSPAIGYWVGRAISSLMGDITITRDERAGLMADLLHTPSPPAGTTKLKAWAREHASELGVHYASELARRKDRKRAYETL
jgi:uncharacterized protein YbjT (DUF2867 family)